LHFVKSSAMNKVRKKRLPKPDNLRQNRRIAVDLTEEQYGLFRKNAAAAGMTFAAYVRQLAVGGTVNARLSEEEKELFRKMVMMSNDLHQLWGMARDQGVEQAMAHFEAGRDAVDKVLNTLNHDKQKLSTRKVFPASGKVSVPGSDQVPGPLPGRSQGTRLPADGRGFRDDPSVTSGEEPPGLPFDTGFPP
jgi:hypothetical protein